MAAPALTSRPVLRAAVCYAAVTIAMGWPLLAAVGTTIASDPGDPLLNAAILAWNAAHVPWTDAWYQFPIFHPTRNALALSEHLLGLSVIASPLLWTTGSAAVAYNLTLLLSYPLCGLAMYALVWRLTRSSPAAFVAGLAYAFAPYRASHLPHIQMLAMFWAPLALLGLHAFAGHAHRPDGDAEGTGASGASRQRAWTRGTWLALFASCWALQGAANGYMLVYFSALVGMWSLWFLAARRRWRDAALVAAAAAVAALPLAPILHRYVIVRRELGLSRNLGEIASFGADIAAPACAAPALAFWGWLRAACAPEGELFPGAALVVLGAAGIILVRRSRDVPEPGAALAPRHRRQGPTVEGAFSRRRVSDLRRGLRALAVALACVFLAVAAAVWVAGPWRLDIGWLRASASSADKPLSTALALLLVAFLLSDRLRASVARGSTLTFYGGAAVVCWVLSWGPFPRLFGTAVLYQAPYAWLLQLPGVDALRVPARFWMLTVLCLSVAAGLVVAQMLRGRNRGLSRAIVVAAACGLLLDGWSPIPAAVLPPPVANAASLRGVPVLVEPAGDLLGDTAAVYHAVTGGWTAINGYSGYEPGYYEALRTLSQADDPARYGPFLRRGDIHVLNGGRRRLAARPQERGMPTPPPGERLALRIRGASCSPRESGAAVDGNPDTRWVCGPQTADHEITFDAGRTAAVAAVVYALGADGASFPRHLVVETSLDGDAWQHAWEGSPAAAVLDAALDAPRETRIVIPFSRRDARYVRLRQTGRHGTTYWSIAEVEVWSGPE